MIKTLTATLLLLAAAGSPLLVTPAVRAQPEAAPSTQQGGSPQERAQELQARAFQAIADGEYPRAEQLLEQQLKLDPANFVIYYNLACVRSLMSDGPGASELVVQAVERGFVDLFQLKRDPQLAAARKEPQYIRLIEAWPKVLDRHFEANLKACAEIFDGKNGPYNTTRDERLRIGIMSAMDPKSTQAAAEDLSRLYDWGLVHVFPELADPAAAKLDAWSMVILPAPKDFLRWAVLTYGQAAMNGFSGIGGSYLHDEKRLVAMDLGATLRHEFFHVLHWRSSTRLGQDHPIWIQEGLCSLVEDYELGPGGDAASLRPVASWRTNMAKRLLGGGALLPIQRLATVPRERFTGSRPLAHYAQARAVFLFIHDSGKLKDWYAAYTSGYRADPTGVKAIEAAFGKAIAEVDKDYRAWLRALPNVAEQIRPGSAGLGVDVEQGDGDGPVIADIPRDTRGRPSAARRAGLRVGDVITHIDGKPTRDLNELVRLLGEKEAGDEVEVSYRRGKLHGKVRVTLTDR